MMAAKGGGWYVGRYAEATGKRIFVPDIGRYASLSDEEFDRLAEQGTLREAPSQLRPGNAGPFDVASEQTGVGMGLNEGYSMADIAHWYRSSFAPVSERGAWQGGRAKVTPDRSSNWFAAGLSEAAQRFRDHLRYEMKQIAARRKARAA